MSNMIIKIKNQLITLLSIITFLIFLTKINTAHANPIGFEQDGTILHAWCWTFNDVTANISQIADSGYTSIQVSPVQPEKETIESPKVFSSWWAFYQPLGFTVGNSLGTPEEFKIMCDTAHSSGIKIIVDIVANHLANKNGFIDSSGICDYSDKIDPKLLSLGTDNLFHQTPGYAIEHANRFSYTQKSIGLPDLNTSNKQLQKIIIDFLHTLQDLGTDGFRFDAARHIELPKEDDGVFGSDFWPCIVSAIKEKDPNCFIYGEILDDSGVTDVQKYLKYINVTDNVFGRNLCKALQQSNTHLIQPYSIKTHPSHLITWVESHDTYAENGRGPTFDLTDEQIRLGWAITATRQGTAPLFLVRPAENKLTRNGEEVLTGTIGGSGNPLWHDKAITEINKFHREMINMKENVYNYDTRIHIIERENKGICIINLSEQDIHFDHPTNLIDGEYIDKISGNVFNVRNSKLCGKINPKSIILLYNPEAKILISQTGGKFKDKVNLTLISENSSYSSYAINSDNEIEFNHRTTLSLGEKLQIGESFSLTLIAKSNTSTHTEVYTFIKEAPYDNITIKLVCDKTHMQHPCIYFYDDTIGFFHECAPWPGIEMPKSHFESNNVFFFSIPNGWNCVKVILSDDGKDQYPKPHTNGIPLTLGEHLHMII